MLSHFRVFHARFLGARRRIRGGVGNNKKFFFPNLGLMNNVSLLRDVVTHPSFISGDITTKFFEDHYPDGFKGIHAFVYYFLFCSRN